MKLKMHQTTIRQKSTRQKAKRRTYKQVMKGGNPSKINIKWNTGSQLFGVIRKGDDEMEIFNKINDYLDTIQSKLKTYADKKLLLAWLEEANNNIDQFERQRFQTYYRGYNGDQLVLKLRRRAVAIGKSINKETAGQQYQSYSNRIREQIREERKHTPRTYIPPIENNLPPAPMRNGNHFNRKQFNNMMHKLEQQKAAQNASEQNALISPSQKDILRAL